MGSSLFNKIQMQSNTNQVPTMPFRTHKQIIVIKYNLIKQFYGIEEYLDMNNPLPVIVDELDQAQSDFNLLLILKELDLWFIQVSGKDREEKWNPFTEPLFEFASRHSLIAAHLYADKQVSDSDIINYARLRQTL